jgi:3-phosphoshikimate 1-carboxyvinyltransferase
MNLRGITYQMPVASAQLKSSLLIAGLFAEGETVITEPGPSRDHSERMLSSMGAKIKIRGNSISISGERPLEPLGDFTVPGDFSSAAFFIVGALIAPGSDVYIKQVGMNPKRTGLLNVLERMGAGITVLNRQVLTGEPVADLRVKYAGRLHAAVIEEKEIPGLIDEVPILSIAAAAASGITVIKGARELRVKESDRLKSMAVGLKALGVEVEEHHDGLSITGKKDWVQKAKIESFGDHRVAMSFSIASLLAGGIKVEGASSTAISYPGFFETLSELARG